MKFICFWIFFLEKVKETKSSNIRISSQRSVNMGSGRDRSRSPVRPSNNRYGSLNRETTEHELINSNNNQNEHMNGSGNQNVKKIPPITVENASVSQAKDLVSRIPFIKSLPEYKVLNNKVKLFTKNVADFEKIVKYMSDNKIDGFTHPLEQKSKFCIFGLDKVDLDELKNELKKLLNVSPATVFSLPLKQKKYNDQYIYVVHFMKSEGITINKLKLIKGLFNIIVRWDHYVPFKQRDLNTPKPPTQCSNCQSFEHGSQFCFRPAKCIRCGKNHKSSDCPFLLSKDADGAVIKKDRIDESNIRCANCGGKHTANFRDCQTRIDIINKRANLRKKPSPQRQFVPSFNDQRHFPPPPPLGRSIGNNSWKNPLNMSSERNPSTQNEAPINDENLFSRTTCNQILNEFISRLSNCRSKSDQLKIIGDMAFKYLLDD